MDFQTREFSRWRRSNRLGPKSRSSIRRLGILALASAAALIFTWNASAASPINTGTFNNVAIKGFDPVAYFQESKPVKGSKKYTHQWRGAEWRFKDATNRDRFAADPEAFAPQYGGYCAWAVSQGSTAGIDPKAWRIVDDKLYLNYSAKIQKRWEEDIPGHIEAADDNWPKLVSE